METQGKLIVDKYGDASGHPERLEDVAGEVSDALRLDTLGDTAYYFGDAVGCRPDETGH